MGFIKLVVFGFVGLTVVYWSVALFARSVTKERLENKFDAENPEGDRNTRDAYIAEGLREYDTSIRPKLVGLVYIVPTVVIGTIIYTINAS